MTEPRPVGVRIAAAAAALVLAVGLPVVIVLLAVVDDRWRRPVSTVGIVLVVGPVVLWFVGRKRPTAAESDDADEPDEAV